MREILKPLEQVEDNIGLDIIKSCRHAFQWRPQRYFLHNVSLFQQGLLDSHYLFKDTRDGILFPAIVLRFRERVVINYSYFQWLYPYLASADSNMALIRPLYVQPIL